MPDKLQQAIIALGESLRGVRGDNPLRWTYNQLSDQNKKQTLHEVFAANALGTTLPILVGPHAPLWALPIAAPVIYDESKKSPVVTEHSGNNGETSYEFKTVYDPAKHTTDTVNVVTISPNGQTNIDNLSNPSLKNSFWWERVYDEGDQNNSWLAPRDFSSKEELLKSRDKVRATLNSGTKQKSGGSISYQKVFK